MTETSNLFPAVDPIPLPAPVWLFKTLHLLTLSLHFVAVGLLLGGLMVGLSWYLAGRRGDASRAAAAKSLAELLPVVMAYVINLGIPPLLFTQVLYGRAFYTSSVLMGAYWISVIFLLMASYYGLYAAARRAGEGRSWGLVSGSSLLLALAIGFLYSNNLTLMLRPEVWQKLYEASPGGLQLNGGDPTVWPRFLFMVAGGLPAAGALLLLLARFRRWAGSAALFRRQGAFALAAGLAAQLAAGVWVFTAQPAGVAEAVRGHAFYGLFPWLWVLTAALAAATALAARGGSAWPAWTAAVAVFLNIAATVIARDGLRDLTLARLGFDVWQSPVVTNWSVVVLFLLLFVAGLATIGWMIQAAGQAAPKAEVSHV